MADPVKVQGPMTVEAFLQWDSGDDFVYELIDGHPRLKFPPNPEIHGQAAPSDEHMVIVGNLTALVTTHVRARRRPCRVMPGPGQVVPRKQNRYRIPDFAVKCGRTAREAVDPILIAEVLSPSNTAVEMDEREADFRSLPTVQEILRIEQSRPAVTLLRRAGDLWRADRLEGLDALLRLESIALDIPLSDLYRDVLDEEDAAAGG